MKWLLVVVLAVIGILAAIVAIEYLTVSIHALPSFIPGHKANDYGHYHKRGAIAAVVALLAFAGAVVLAIRFRRADAAPTASGASAQDLLSGPGTGPGAAG